MPEKLKCPSCGGSKVELFTYQGQQLHRCVTVVHKDNGRHGRARREWDAPCGFWTTKESAWQRTSS